jgi:lipoprotein NlpI
MCLRFFWPVVVAGLMLLTPAAQAQLSPQWQSCTGNPGVDWDQQIRSCSTLIQSDREPTQNRAIAYYRRGLAYVAKGDPDHAIADYTEAIRLDPKFAQAYGSRGNVYLDDKGDLDRAIADYSEMIRLDPKEARIYNNRGLAYVAKGDSDRAITDYTQAIRLNPDYVKAYNNRAFAYFISKGDLDHAIADYTEAIRLDPKGASAYLRRGIAHFYNGNLAKALADVRQSSELDPKDAFSALWLDIVGERSNIPSRLSQAVSEIDIRVWPAQVIQLYLGQMTPAAVLAAADDPDAKKKKDQVCGATFYTAELARRQSVKDDAVRLFRLAASECPHDVVEWVAADAELKALGIAQ